MTSATRARLTEGPVGRHLIRLTVPMIWGLLAMMTFNVADTYFVGQLGVRELAAMSFTFPVVFAFISIVIIFQPELRHGITRLGRTPFARHLRRFGLKPQDAAEILLVARWFRLNPRERRRTLSPEAWLAEKRPA